MEPNSGQSNQIKMGYNSYTNRYFSPDSRLVLLIGFKAPHYQNHLSLQCNMTLFKDSDIVYTGSNHESISLKLLDSVSNTSNILNLKCSFKGQVSSLLSFYVEFYKGISRFDIYIASTILILSFVSFIMVFI